MTLVAYPAPKNVLEVLMSRMGNVSGESLILSKLRGLPWRALLGGGMMKISPYSISVQ